MKIVKVKTKKRIPSFVDFYFLEYATQKKNSIAHYPIKTAKLLEEIGFVEVVK